MSRSKLSILTNICMIEEFKTKRVCVLGEVGRDVSTASMRKEHLQKVAAEVKKLS